MLPIVSAIIPVYNVENYLSCCIESAINQTYPHLEIILINDGSTDASPEICKQYARRHKNVTVINQDNHGPSEARNAGIRISSGKYIYFLDSDDFLREDAIEMLVKVAEQYNTEIVLFDAVVVDEHGEILNDEKLDKWYERKRSNYGVLAGIEALRQTIENNDFRASVVLQLFKKDLLLRKKLTFHPGIIHEDELFSFCALAYAERAIHIPDSLYFRRWRANSIMSSDFTHINVKGYCRVIKELVSFCDALPDNLHYKEFADRIFLNMIIAVNKFASLEIRQQKLVQLELAEAYKAVEKSRIIAKYNLVHANFSQMYQNAKRVVFYGAGRKCRTVIDILQKANHRLPDVIWDKSASDISSVMGIEISSPDFESLRYHNDWILVVCIVDPTVCDEIVALAEAYGFDNVYNWRELYSVII